MDHSVCLLHVASHVFLAISLELLTKLFISNFYLQHFRVHLHWSILNLEGTVWTVRWLPQLKITLISVIDSKERLCGSCWGHELLVKLWFEKFLNFCLVLVEKLLGVRFNYWGDLNIIYVLHVLYILHVLCKLCILSFITSLMCSVSLCHWCLFLFTFCWSKRVLFWSSFLIRFWLQPVGWGFEKLGGCSRARLDLLSKRVVGCFSEV